MIIPNVKKISNLSISLSTTQAASKDEIQDPANRKIKHLEDALKEEKERNAKLDQSLKKKAKKS